MSSSCEFKGSPWRTTSVAGVVMVLLAGCTSSDADPPDDAAGGGGSGGGAGEGGGSSINEGFIGGPCTADDDCDYPDGFCLTEAEGFPDGMCSLDCELLCPDQDGAVTTFCAEPAELGTTALDGLCTMRCEYGQSPTGCRAGYQCRAIPRNGEPDTVVYACVPGQDDPFVLGSCHHELLARGIPFSPAVNPLDTPEGLPNATCDIQDPVWVSPNLSGVAYRPVSIDAEPKAIFTACPHALAMDDAAAIASAFDITDVVQLGVYSCRVIAGTSTMSEHGFARAIDIAGVGLASGAYYTVLGDWEVNQPTPTTDGGILLKEFIETVFNEGVYNIILTPDYNEAHADHFHCDLTPGGHYFR